MAVVFAGMAWAMYAGSWRRFPAAFTARFSGLYRFTLDKFRVDELYDFAVIRVVRGLAYGLWRFVDVLVIDGIVNGVAATARGFARLFREIQNGEVQRYAAIMAVAAAVILWVVLGGVK